jgi:cysteinyl-tRNA synthetase
MSPNKKVRIPAKLEGQNLGGSASLKDRVAKHMIEKAEQGGELTRYRIISEATSGNTGIALAWLGHKKGYKVTVTNYEVTKATRQLLDREGIFTGLSSGAVISQATEVAAEMDEGNILVILADGG